MRKLIFAINVTIDGFADHTAGIADDELHDFFADMLDDADIVLFGRKTYELLADFWPDAAKDPRITKGMLHYADKINKKQKIVFSGTLDKVTWVNARLIKNDAVGEIVKLKNESGKNILIGGISLASELMNRKLIDEFWLLVHPVILGNGRSLWKGVSERIDLKLVEISKFNSGVVVLHYLQNQL